MGAVAADDEDVAATELAPLFDVALVGDPATVRRKARVATVKGGVGVGGYAPAFIV